METINYLSLKSEIDLDGSVIAYKNFVVVSEFFTGPRGEYFHSRVYRPVDDLEDFSIYEARLELCSEKWAPGADTYETEGEALMAAFIMIERGRFGEVE